MLALYLLQPEQRLDPSVNRRLGGARQPEARPYVTLYPGDTRDELTVAVLDKMEAIVRRF